MGSRPPPLETVSSMAEPRPPQKGAQDSAETEPRCSREDVVDACLVQSCGYSDFWPARSKRQHDQRANHSKSSKRNTAPAAHLAMGRKRGAPWRASHKGPIQLAPLAGRCRLQAPGPAFKTSSTCGPPNEMVLATSLGRSVLSLIGSTNVRNWELT